MKKLIISTAILLLTTALPAQEYIDIVHLKNGGLIRGIIIENIPNDKVKIKTRDGSIFVYKYEEIEKFTKEENQKTEKIEKTEKKSDKTANKQLYDEMEKSQALGCLFTFFVPGGQHFYAKEYATGIMYVALTVGAYVPYYIYLNKFSDADDKYKKTRDPGDRKKAEKDAKYAAYSILALLGIRIVDVLHGFYSIDNYNDKLKEKYNLTTNQNRLYPIMFSAYDDIYKERRYHAGMTMTF